MQDYYTPKGKHLTLADRRNIERWLQEGYSNREIAKRLARAPQTINKEAKLYADYAKGFVQLLAPFAPHLAEELWQGLTQTGETISYVAWPTWDESKLIESDVEIVVQIKGKVRAKIIVPKDSSREDLETIALANDKIKSEIAGKDIVKVIAVPNKLVNIVVK